MFTKTALAMAGMAVATAFAQPPAAAQEREPMARSTEALIEDAMRAGPEQITRDATIMEWPMTEGGEPTELRAGTNGWTCFASSTAAVSRGGMDPMCLDQTSLEFFQAWSERREPQIDRVGIVYMLEGDTGASNTDPFAVEETADNEWVVAGPHIMLVVPDPSMLEMLPTDPEEGGPWVMWSGTPWAHVMVPTGEVNANNLNPGR